jgi:hypothetical protein
VYHAPHGPGSSGSGRADVHVVREWLVDAVAAGFPRLTVPVESTGFPKLKNLNP